MYLIQLFLPLYDNAGKAFARTLYEDVRTELTERFGGLTAHSRAPVTGLWKEGEDSTVRDDLLIYEVMAHELDRDWWRRRREALERTFRQETIVIRALAIDLL